MQKKSSQNVQNVLWPLLEYVPFSVEKAVEIRSMLLSPDASI